MRRRPAILMNALLAVSALVFLVSIAFISAGGGSMAAADPGQPHQTAPPSTATPTTAPPATPATTAPVATPSTAPPATAPQTAPTTPRVTYPRRVVPLRPRVVSPVTPLAPAPTAPTTSTTTTTIAAIGGRLPPAPVTLPLTTKSSNAHVDPLFAWLSGIGFLVAILVVAGRFIASRPKRRRARAQGSA